MQVAQIVVILFRFLCSFLILRWPFWGVVTNLFVDLFDTAIILLLGGSSWTNYNVVDKSLDSFYLLIAAYKSKDWEKIPRKISYGLFSYRILGVLLFFATNIRGLLLFFPNIFELWFIFWAARNKWFAKTKLTWKLGIVVFLVIIGIKLYHEYVLHVAEFCTKPQFNICGLENYFPPFQWWVDFMNQ